MGFLRTTFLTPIDTPSLALETMSVDELVNIIKEEEGIAVDDNNDINDIPLSFSHDNYDRHHHNQISPPSVVEVTNDDDSSSNNEESDDSDDDDDDHCDDHSDDGNNRSSNKGPYPPPYYPYPHYAHYPMPPVHHPYMGHMPPDHHHGNHPYPGSTCQNPHVYTDASTMTDPAPDTRRNRGGVTEPFPEKLHRMLDAVEREGLSDVVSFFSHGRAFAIHKPRRFVTEVMLRFFRQTRLTSFQRQLNLYGFRRISTGPDNGGYYHELFLKGRPGLCVNMKRTKVKGTSKLKRDPDTEPNFYAMRPIAPGGPPPISNNGGGGGPPPNAPYYPPPYYPPPPPPSYPPYTAAQNGSMHHPPPPPGYYPPPPPPPHYAYHNPYPWYPPQPPQQQQPMKQKPSSRHDHNTSSPLPPQIQSHNSLDDLEVPELPLPEVTEDDV